MADNRRVRTLEIHPFPFLNSALRYGCCCNLKGDDIICVHGNWLTPRLVLREKLDSKLASGRLSMGVGFYCCFLTDGFDDGFGCSLESAASSLKATIT